VNLSQHEHRLFFARRKQWQHGIAAPDAASIPLTRRSHAALPSRRQLGLLVLASLVGWVLEKRATSDAAKLTMANLNARTRAWWLMVAVFAGALAAGYIGTTILFGFISFMALREFVTLTPTKPGDHRTFGCSSSSRRCTTIIWPRSGTVCLPF